DELPDLGGRCFGLLALDADQRSLVLLVGKADLEQDVGEEDEAHDRDEQRHIFAEQRPVDLAPAAGPDEPCEQGPARGLVRMIDHSITWSARRTSDSAPFAPVGRAPPTARRALYQA